MSSRSEEALRERFRENLVGIWGTASYVPMGEIWEFRADGTGVLTDCRGFGADSISLEWRPWADWKIQIKIERGKEWYEDLEEVPPLETPWITMAYNFAYEKYGYRYETCLNAWFEDYTGPELPPGILDPLALVA